jgi:hypothetical protein
MIRDPRWGVREECPVTRSAWWWAVSPLDFCVHLVPRTCSRRAVVILMQLPAAHVLFLPCF